MISCDTNQATKRCSFSQFSFIVLLFIADNDVYQPCYQSTMVANLQHQCGYSSLIGDCR